VATLRETAQTLNSAAIHLLRGVRPADRLSGLTPARLSALSVLVFGGPSPLGRLAKIEGVTSPTMTRIVDGLCDLRLAERQPHPDSSRIVMITATEVGRALMREAAARRTEMITGALRQLGPAERDLVQRAAPLLQELAGLLRLTGPR
jgi:DNA-binding MarR family transcriptional regulator